MRLSEVEVEMLAFERGRFKYAGAREQAIRDRFGVSPLVYSETLRALVDSPAALAHDPVTVRRLQRLREARRAQRSAGRLAAGL